MEELKLLGLSEYEEKIYSSILEDPEIAFRDKIKALTKLTKSLKKKFLSSKKEESHLE